MLQTDEICESVFTQIAVLDIKEVIRLSEIKFVCSLVCKVAHSECIFFEVGSWKGYSAAFIGEIAKQNKGHLYCVDHWHGSPGVLHHTTSADCVLSVFRKNMASLGLSETVLPMAMSSVEAGNIVADNIADFVFIDADHRYKSVQRDIDIWWRKLKVGGILCGHDCEKKWRNLSQIERTAINKNLSLDYIRIGFDCYHLGVIKALYKRFNDEYDISDDMTVWWKVKEESDQNAIERFNHCPKKP